MTSSQLDILRRVDAGDSLYECLHCTAYLLRNRRKTPVPFGDVAELMKGGFVAPVSMNKLGLTEAGRTALAEESR
jgi:hypothetical protein